MRPHSRFRRTAPRVLAVAVLCTAGVLFTGLGPASADADPSQPVIVVPTVPADPGLPATPDPTPPPTTEPQPSNPPVVTPVPTDPPVVTPAPAETAPPVVVPVPTEVPADTPPATEAPAPETVQPSDEPTYDPGPIAPEESETPVPTETATIAPAPIVTATAAPAPAIELPFYPPPSAGTAHDTFPFAFAGVIGGGVLLLGIAAYVLTRLRLSRMSSATRPGRANPPVRGQTSGGSRSTAGAGAFGAASAFARRLPSGGAVPSLALPWASEPGGSTRQGAGGASFELGFAASAAQASAVPESNLLDAGFGQAARVTRDSAGPAATAFDLGLASAGREDAAAEALAPTTDLRVFSAPRASADPSLLERFKLSFGSRPPAAAASAAGNFELGLPGLS